MDWYALLSINSSVTMECCLESGIIPLCSKMSLLNLRCCLTIYFHLFYDLFTLLYHCVWIFRWSFSFFCSNSPNVWRFFRANLLHGRILEREISLSLVKMSPTFIGKLLFICKALWIHWLYVKVIPADFLHEEFSSWRYSGYASLLHILAVLWTRTWRKSFLC